MCTARLPRAHVVNRCTGLTQSSTDPVVGRETEPIESPRCARQTDEVDFSRSSSADSQTRGTRVNDFGSAHPFGGQGHQGSSASEIPPLMPNPSRVRASVDGAPTPAASAGGPDRVSDPIPFRRPMPSAGDVEELHAADPPVSAAGPAARRRAARAGPHRPADARPARAPPHQHPRQRPGDLDVQPEGRRRQDHDDDQPGRRARGVRPQGAARRLRPAGLALGRPRASTRTTWSCRSTTC